MNKITPLQVELTQFFTNKKIQGYGTPPDPRAVAWAVNYVTEYCEKEFAEGEKMYVYRKLLDQVQFLIRYGYTNFMVTRKSDDDYDGHDLLMAEIVNEYLDSNPPDFIEFRGEGFSAFPIPSSDEIRFFEDLYKLRKNLKGIE